MPDYQAIGEALVLPLGFCVTGNILPAIQNYKREIERLKAMITDACMALERG